MEVYGEREDDKFKIYVDEIAELPVWIWVNLYIFQRSTSAFLSFRDKSRKWKWDPGCTFCLKLVTLKFLKAY